MNTKLKSPLIFVLVFTMLVTACGVAPWADEIERANATLAAAQKGATARSIQSTAAAYGTPGGPVAVETQVAPGATAAGSSTTTTGYCPTRREVNDMIFGKNADASSKDVVVQVSTEDGAWQVNTGQPTNYFSATLPTGKGLVATIHRVGASKAEVYLADGKKYDLFRGTFRFSGCYAPTDDMNAANNAVRILVKENFNGAYQVWLNNKRVQDWTFSVLAGNFSCPTDICPNAATAATFVPQAPAANVAPCPTFGGVTTTSGNDGSPFCKYTGSVVTDKVPTGWNAQYWDGSATKFANPGESIKTGEATFRIK